MVRTTIRVVVAVLAVACVGGAPAIAGAADKPAKATVSTGGASGIQPIAATVRGAINAQGVATTYSFQYGTTKNYEATTPELDGGGSRKARKVKAALLNLAPYTTYHYRIVARNARGVVRGKDRTFKTKKQPLGLVVNADRNPVAVDQYLTLAGQLSGTDNKGRQITLQSKPFPYTSDWAPVAGINDVIVGEGGLFAFRIPAVAFNTLFRVSVAGKPDRASPIVPVGVKPRVSTTVTKRKRDRTHRRGRITWRGAITPNRDGAQVVVQKKRRGSWVAVGSAIVQRKSDTQSRYRVSARQRRGGTYRVVIASLDGAFVPGDGRETKVKVRLRR